MANGPEPPVFPPRIRPWSSPTACSPSNPPSSWATSARRTSGIPEGNPHYQRLLALAAEREAPCIPICSKLEAEIQDLPEEDRPMFLEEAGLAEPGLNVLIHASYDLLGLQTYFTAGVKEVRAWTIHKGDYGPPGRRRHPHGFREGLHPGPGHRLRRLHPVRRGAGCQGRGEDADGRKGIRCERRGFDEFPLQCVDPTFHVSLPVGPRSGQAMTGHDSLPVGPRSGQAIKACPERPTWSRHIGLNPIGLRPDALVKAGR